MLLCALGPFSVHAQETAAGASTEPPEYRGLINAALDEYEQHNFAEARALFLRAHALVPSARTLRGLGMAEFELKNYDDSVLRLEAALASPVKHLEGALRQQTEDLLVRARAFVGRFALQLVPSDPPGLRLSLDGAPITPSPELILTVPVGEHLLWVTATGYQEEKRTLSVQGSEQESLEIQLHKAESAPPLALQATPKSDARPVWKNPWLWTGIGAVIVAGVVAGVMVAHNNKNDKPSGEAADFKVETLLHAGR